MEKDENNIKNSIKNNKNIITAAIIAAVVLAATFFWGGKAPFTENNSANVTAAPLATLLPEASPSVTLEPAETGSPTYAPDAENIADAGTEPSALPIKKPGDTATEENKPSAQNGEHLSAAEKMALADMMAGKSEPAALQESYYLDSGTAQEQPADNSVTIADADSAADKNYIGSNNDDNDKDSDKDKEMTCTLSVRCDTVLDNMAWLDKSKAGIIPADGIIFEEQTVSFYEGESVFNLLKREMKKNKIHMEFVNTPVYNSAYIEGIANLYEFDCGELSGWMYRVNGVFPNYGCSLYTLKEGDRVEWVYTCDLGHDVGGGYSSGGQGR